MNHVQAALSQSIKAVLFDLDDTLLTTRLGTFLPGYFRALTRHLSGVVDPKTLIDSLMEATAIMTRRHDPGLTNQEVFDRHFFPRIGIAREMLTPLFDEFYATGFPALRQLTSQRPEARPVVDAAIARYDDVVIATQPVFPMTAIHQRMAWAGVDGLPYRLVTAYENMHTCKPDPAYYQEIANRIDKQPGHCLMVGNDLDQDIAPAALAGMATFHIVEDVGQPPGAHSGRLADLLVLLTA